MEFSFDINNLFGGEITVVNREMKPCRHVPGSLEVKKQMHQVIDKMGVASSKAQGLDQTITTATRLGCADHHLYVMKDEQANDGKGAVVGILKMGSRKLFVYDHLNKHHEMDPLCVLDFYIHESRQRMGCGKKLYEFMLQEENVRPAHLAVDRPSPKFQAFLQKHYNLKAKIPQVNNFVVYEGFFRERPKPGALNERFPNGRQQSSATSIEKQPFQRCPSASCIPKCVTSLGILPWAEQNPTKTATETLTIKAATPVDIRPRSAPSTPVTPETVQSQAMEKITAKFNEAMLNQQQQQQQQKSNHDSGKTQLMQKSNDEAKGANDKRKSVHFWDEGSGDSLEEDVEGRELLQQVPLQRPSSVPKGPRSDVDPSLMAGQASGYSRHLSPTQPQPPPAASMDNVQQGNAQQQRKQDTNTASEPPLLRRDGPSNDYLKLTNQYQGDARNPSAYMDRRGHLRVGSSNANTAATQNASLPTQNASGRGDLPPSNPYGTPVRTNQQQDTSWNVFGVPHNGSAGARKMQHTKLW